MPRLHPLSLPAGAFFALALLANLVWVDWRSAALQYFAGFLLLASPFLILLLGQIFVAHSWRGHLFLTLTALPLFFGWALASVAMGWFQMGWAGVKFFSLVLNGFAAAFLLIAALIKEA